MCGIAGIIHRGGTAPVGQELTKMLQSLKHRGPDSTGLALYGPRTENFKVRYVLGDPTAERGLDYEARISRAHAEVERRIAALGAKIVESSSDTDYAFRVVIDYSGDLKALTDHIEAVPGAEVLSIGHSLELVKDLGDADTVSAQYGLDSFQGTHALGHVRMATESVVDIAGAHPYWAYPFSDVAVVHNGQLTNYHTMRRALEREGHRFQSDCDSEVIAVYLANQRQQGVSLEVAMKQSLEVLDGVFTYLAVTEDALGFAKDSMAAKPLVVYESDDVVAVASEELAIAEVVGAPGEAIDTYDPYENEVRVWTV